MMATVKVKVYISTSFHLGSHEDVVDTRIEREKWDAMTEEEKRKSWTILRMIT